MRVQEFDNLTDWFKENVLHIRSTADEAYDYEIDDEANASSVDLEIADVKQVQFVMEKPTEAEEERSLIEYIIGVDGMDA